MKSSAGSSAKEQLSNWKTVTLLSRKYKSVSCFSLLSYLTLQIGLYYNRNYSSCPICELPSTAFSAWTGEVNLLVAGAFTTSSLLQLTRLALGEYSEDHLGVHAAIITTLTVNLIAAASNWSTWLYGWGGVCQDYYG